MSGLFPNIWTIPSFQKIYYLPTCCDFVPLVVTLYRNFLIRYSRHCASLLLTVHIYIIRFSEVPSVQFHTGLVQQIMTYLNFRCNDSLVTRTTASLSAANLNTLHFVLGISPCFELRILAFSWLCTAPACDLHNSVTHSQTQWSEIRLADRKVPFISQSCGQPRSVGAEIPKTAVRRELLSEEGASHYRTGVSNLFLTKDHYLQCRLVRRPHV